MNKFLLCILLLFSSTVFAQFTTTSTTVTFSDSLNGQSVASKEIEFTNQSNNTASAQFSLNKQSPLIGTSSDFGISLNRCVNVRAKQKCKVTLRFNSRGLPGSANGLNYLASLNYGSSSVNLAAKVVSSAPVSNPIITSDKNTLSFQVFPLERKSAAQSVTIRNTGTTTTPIVSLSNTNNFQILVNRCSRALTPSDVCVVSLVYLPKDTDSSSGTLTIGGKIINISGMKILDVAPVGDSSLQVFELQASQSINQQVTLSSGTNLTWQLLSAPAGMSISQQGVISFSPSISQVGTYPFQVRAVNQVGTFIKSFQVKVKPYVEISSLVFDEGLVSNNLLLVKIKSGVVVNKLVSSNLSNYITTIRAKKNGSAIDNFTRLSDDESGNTISIGEASPVNFSEISIDGAVKFKTSSTLDFTLETAAGDFSYSYPITINSLNKPYIKYDIFAVKGNGSITGDSPSDVMVNISEFKRVTENWRIPIIMRYKVKQINCNGTLMDDYYGDNTNHKNCVSLNSSPDAETAFWFRQTYSTAGNPIGGRAQGIQNGVVIEKNPWFYTLAHEIGHNLGLFHTFESSGNLLPGNGLTYITHKDSSDVSPKQRSIYATVTNRPSMTFPGDWLDYLFNFASSIVSFNYNVGASDTPVDYYSAKKVSLYNNFEGCFGFCVYPNDPFRNGDTVYLGYDLQGDFTGRANGYACQLNTYDFITKNWTTTCEYPAVLNQGTIKNVMSYWYKYNDNSAELTNGQKSRMDSVLNYGPYQYLGVQ